MWFYYVSIIQFFTSNQHRYQAEEAVNLLHRPDMIIKLVNPEVMVKLIDLNLCTIDGVMTLKSLRKRSEPLPNGKQSRGIFAWRAEKSRIMIRLFANLFDLITLLSSSHKKATVRDFSRAPVLCSAGTAVTTTADTVRRVATSMYQVCTTTKKTQSRHLSMLHLLNNDNTLWRKCESW